MLTKFKGQVVSVANRSGHILAGMVLAAPVFAAPDVTAITAVLTDVATVAAAVFGVFVAIKAAKFIRRAL